MRKSFALRHLASLAVGCATFLAAAAGAQATPVTYTLNGASANFGAGQVAISGTFTFDAATVTLSSPDIKLTGPGFPGLAFTVPIGTVQNVDEEFGFVGQTWFLGLGFAAPLSGVADPLVQVFGRTSSLFNAAGSAVAGSAVPPLGSVPEPASLGLIGGALLGFGLLRGRCRMRAGGRRAAQ